MVQLKIVTLDKRHKSKKSNNRGKRSSRYNRLNSMGKISVDIINELYNPVDAVNRFINLALQNTDDGAQSRQFLLESKLKKKRDPGRTQI